MSAGSTIDQIRACFGEVEEMALGQALDVESVKEMSSSQAIRQVEYSRLGPRGGRVRLAYFTRSCYRAASF